MENINMIVEFEACDALGEKIIDSVKISDDLQSDDEIIEFIEKMYCVTNVELNAFNS